MTDSDGLAALQGKRSEAVGRRRRQPPRPHHPRAVVNPADQGEGSGVLSAASDETFVSQTTSVGTGPLRPAQFYIDDAIDGYLRSIRAEALVRKLDVTGSAVVRLALHRLMQELTPQQVTNRLAEPAAPRSSAGRKRR